MRIIREKPKRELINITPLIDVVFILLVFFMLAGSIEPKDAFPISPPASTSKMRGDIQDFVILIDKNGRIAMGDQRVPGDQVEKRVRQALTSRPDGLIQLKPDADADAVDVIKVMESIRAGGAEYIVLLTVGSGAGHAQ